MDKSRELLEKLMHSITTMHLDMGGNHRYALSFKSHKIITEINGFLNEPLNKVVEDGCACTEPRSFHGNGVVVVCDCCSLPIIDRRTT